MCVDYFSDFEYISVSNACTGEGNDTPLQYSCLENPRDGGAWWLQSMGLLRVHPALDSVDAILSGCLLLVLVNPSSREWSQRSRETARQEVGLESAQQNLVQERSLEPVSLRMVPDAHVTPLVHAGFPYISSHVMLPAAVQGEQRLVLLFPVSTRRRLGER